MALTPKQEGKAWQKIAGFLEPRPENMRKLLFNVMKFIKNNVWIRFRNQKSAILGKWPANAPSTVAAKGHNVVGIGKTHELVRAIDTQEARFDSAGAVLGEDLPDHAEYFSVKTQHTSSKGGAYTIPARPIMEVTEKDENQALALLEMEIFRILEHTK